MKLSYLLIVLSSLVSMSASAGPPYDTDDPEPVDFQHWEFYCSSIGSTNAGVSMGTAPHVEVNYGAIHNMQLHVIAPLAFDAVKGDKTAYGFGDTEFGIKYRFVNKDSGRFQVGIFPLIEIPTGNASEGLGNGKPQVFLPLWVQETTGKWTTYGGGGYWLNPGTGNKNYAFAGWLAQYQFVKSVSAGCEVSYSTASHVGDNGEFRARLGSVIDISENHHLLFSVGRNIIGSANLLWYFGYQFTI